MGRGAHWDAVASGIGPGWRGICKPCMPSAVCVNLGVKSGSKSG
jgi:hypothetical protein